MGGAELDGDLEEGASEPETTGSGEPLIGELPPDEPARGGGGGGGAGSGRSGGNLSTQGLVEQAEGTPARGSLPFLNLEFDPVVYWLTILDSKSNEHAAEYRSIPTRSECVVHYLTRLAFEDFAAKLQRGEISGMQNAIAERLLKVMRFVANAAHDQIHEAARADIVSTLVQAGIATQERLEEVLGVTGSGVA